MDTVRTQTASRPCGSAHVRSSDTYAFHEKGTRSIGTASPPCDSGYARPSETFASHEKNTRSTHSACHPCGSAHVRSDGTCALQHRGTNCMHTASPPCLSGSACPVFLPRPAWFFKKIRCGGCLQNKKKTFFGHGLASICVQHHRGLTHLSTGFGQHF